MIFLRFAGAKISTFCFCTNFYLFFFIIYRFFRAFLISFAAETPYKTFLLQSDMLDKTIGIILSAIPYNDHTLFLHIYTERFGKVTYQSSLRRTNRKASNHMMLAPMTLLEMDVEHQPGNEIQKIREMRLLSSPYSFIMSHPVKATQCLFMAELLDKVIREEECNPKLFRFIRQSIELLELTETGCANFHLIFFIRLCYLLGFRIDQDTYSDGARFDIKEGIFTLAPISHPHYLTAESAYHFYRMLQVGFSDMQTLALNREQRNNLTDMLLLYLKIHLPEMGDIRSIEVLKELFV